MNNYMNARRWGMCRKPRKLDISFDTSTRSWLVPAAEDDTPRAAPARLGASASGRQLSNAQALKRAGGTAAPVIRGGLGQAAGGRLPKRLAFVKLAAGESVVSPGATAGNGEIFDHLAEGRRGGFDYRR